MSSGKQKRIRRKRAVKQRVLDAKAYKASVAMRGALNSSNKNGRVMHSDNLAGFYEPHRKAKGSSDNDMKLDWKSTIFENR